MSLRCRYIGNCGDPYGLDRTKAGCSERIWRLQQHGTPWTVRSRSERGVRGLSLASFSPYPEHPAILSKRYDTHRSNPRPGVSSLEPSLCSLDASLLRCVVLSLLDSESPPFRSRISRRGQTRPCRPLRRLGLCGLDGITTAGLAGETVHPVLGADPFRVPVRHQRRVSSVLRARPDTGILGRVRRYGRRRHRTTCPLSPHLAAA